MDDKSTTCQQASCGEDVDLCSRSTQNCEGEKPMVSTKNQRENVACILERDIEDKASCSHSPSEHNTDADDRNVAIDITAAALGQDQSENLTSLQSSVDKTVLWSVPEPGLVSGITPFPCLQIAGKSLEANLNNGAIQRTVSTFSIDSVADYCRVCHHMGEEPLIELGCHCRGELAKAHRSCIQQWFNNKGSNKCEVCQHVATNLPPPTSQPKQNFWVWRLNRPYGVQRTDDGVGQSSNSSIRPVLLLILRRHPSITLLWLFLLIFMTYLFVDVVGSSSVGYAAMAIGFLFGVLVVLGLGTGARLIAECWHERNMMRNSQRMETPQSADHIQVGID